MIDRTIRVALLALLLTACGSGLSQIQTVEGLVVEVESDSPVAIDAFTLRTDQGEQLHFSLGGVDFGHGAFPATHLREHQALAQPVRVSYRAEGGVNLVVRLEDAD
ncbi:MAG: hypothetical protein M3452_02970 [Chloroflexota bacterium]|nr:hypothetical protein [Chloroflexota bacterium]